MTRTTLKTSAVIVRPKPKPTLIQSAKLSPTVVHKILMTQNQMATSGTLLSITRRRLSSSAAVSITRPTVSTAS